MKRKLLLMFLILLGSSVIFMGCEDSVAANNRAITKSTDSSIQKAKSKLDAIDKAESMQKKGH